MLIIDGVAIGGVIAACIIIPSEVAAAKERRRERALAAVAPAPEKQETKPTYSPAQYAPPKRAGEGVHGILFEAYRSLAKQNAAGHRGWLSCCIERLQNGLPVPVSVALRALYMTRKELEGARYDDGEHPPVYFDLSGLDAAIASLEMGTGV